MRNSKNCLLIYPPFTSQSFWNYRKTCELLNASYPAPPLGLITIAAMLPDSWAVRLIDCNVEELSEEDLEWADIVMSGGMIAQQTSHLELVERIKGLGKLHVVGGPDATSCPHLYDEASHLILGEAELTLPRFLEDFSAGKAQHVYRPAANEKNYTKTELADMTTSPVPRFDLLQFNKYLHVGIQFARGCPFRCEFCDIIELFGRIPRVKSEAQIMAELQRLYDLGYRGHVDFVDDNFIGNKKAVKNFLPRLRTWLEQNKWPFEFSTEASMNLSDDEELMQLMQEVGFSAIFVGIESPDEVTLQDTQKRQNTRRSIPASIHKIYGHGMLVNAGYIVGLDGERGSVARGIVENIEDTAIPVNMVGLLFALSNTQLSRRLKKEGRLQDNFEVVANDVGDQCVAGLNFQTLRPRREILNDYRSVIKKVYSPTAYFGRVRRMTRMLNCSKKRLKLPFGHFMRDLLGLSRVIVALGIKAPYRREFWKVFFDCLLSNPRAMRYSMAMAALYMHLGEFGEYVVGRISDEITRTEEVPTLAVSSLAGGMEQQASAI